jgi:hypothetical protein
MSHSFPPTTETAAGKRPRGDYDDRTKRRLNRAGFFMSQQHPAYVEYEQMHKRLVGPKTANKLLRIHNELVDAPIDTDYLSIAGWAAAEAALVATDRPQEERLDFLECAADAWDFAIDYRKEEGNYQSEDEEYEDAVLSRLKLSRMFAPLMESMIRGDVTKEVRARLYDDLLTLAAENAMGLETARQGGREAGPYIGLGHEINAMLAVNRLHSPTLLAMPALARGDSGHFHPQQTHDIELLHLQWGEIQGVTTLESKARPRARHYRRYEAAIVGGRIHLFTKKGSSPADTVLLFLKEEKGELTNDEFEELDHMTDTIVHLARHQLSDDPEVPPHCRDIRRCNKVPLHRSAKLPRALGGLAAAAA